MITHEDIQPGTHCWAQSSEQTLLIVLKVSDDYYEVCGPWECGIRKEEIEIISIIDKPEGHENMDLYYKVR